MAKLNYKNGDPSITITVDNNSKTITQATAEAVAEPTTNELIDLFRPINPTINFGNKTQRKAIETLISKIGSGKTKNAINYAVSIQGTKFSPTITTPIQLLNRYGELQAYYLKNNKINVARI
jgi:enhancing lycopene biosynthesis protein 2